MQRGAISIFPLKDNILIHLKSHKQLNLLLDLGLSLRHPSYVSISHFHCLHKNGKGLQRKSDLNLDLLLFFTNHQIKGGKKREAANKRFHRLSKIMAQSTAASTFNQKFDYFLVLDFEATCDNTQRITPQEIIEFPVLKVNARTHKIDSIFHKYVLPQYHPNLTPFCTELTGIVQDMVENQPYFPEVLQSFNQWMESEGLLEPGNHSIFVTCGDWDLKSMLPRQCTSSNVASKPYFKRWINIKKSYADVTGSFPKGMMNMLTGLDLKHEGRHHSGIDDCHNIASILIALMQRGYIFRENGRLS